METTIVYRGYTGIMENGVCVYGGFLKVGVPFESP